jgi:battenin
MEVEEGFAGRREDRRNLAAFWLLGLLNNLGYVVMLAGANSISAGAVGAVYAAAVLPGAFLKLSAPFWFHRVRYATRVLAAALLMMGAYSTVALTSRRGPQLAGVALASLQGALGEASCLALTSRYNSRAVITMWSSGTGFAGVAGYAWVAALHVAAGWSLRATLLSANVTAAAWLAVYFGLLVPPEARARQLRELERADEQLVGAAMAAMAGGDGEGGSSGDEEGGRLLAAAAAPGGGAPGAAGGSGARPRSPAGKALSQGSRAAARMGCAERLRRTAALWPYTVPLLLVYFAGGSKTAHVCCKHVLLGSYGRLVHVLCVFRTCSVRFAARVWPAEYSMQSGVWTAIGFPVSSPAARQRFYVLGNWAYQSGVFLARSSGLAWQASRSALWAMPAAQLGWLAFFLGDALHHWWNNWGLLGPCFLTGAPACLPACLCPCKLRSLPHACASCRS